MRRCTCTAGSAAPRSTRARARAAACVRHHIRCVPRVCSTCVLPPLCPPATNAQDVCAHRERLPLRHGRRHQAALPPAQGLPLCADQRAGRAADRGVRPRAARQQAQGARGGGGGQRMCAASAADGWATAAARACLAA
jgi:hypothetical protein